MSATLDPINRAFWFSCLYLAMSVPGGRNSITSWRQDYNCRIFEVFQICRFETQMMSRIKSNCYPAPSSLRPLSSQDEEVVEVEQTQSGNQERDGTGRNERLYNWQPNKFSASSYGRYENEEGKENPAVRRYMSSGGRRLGRFRAFLMANMWLKGRYSALHCIALHRAKRVLKLPNEDEGMEIEVLLIELYMYVTRYIACMYYCTCTCTGMKRERL